MSPVKPFPRKHRHSCLRTSLRFTSASDWVSPDRPRVSCIPVTGSGRGVEAVSGADADRRPLRPAGQRGSDFRLR
jgi:hypothetical protein